MANQGKGQAAPGRTSDPTGPTGAERTLSEEELPCLRTELEERVAARMAELQAANEDLEAFSCSISHDLRAPLRHIAGYAQLLEEHLQDRLDPEGRRLLDTITASARDMAGLLDALLRFSRVGRADLVIEEVDVRATLEEALASLQAEIERGGVEISLGELPKARADTALLKQVWTNLLANAFKFTRPRPRPVVEIGSRTDGPRNVYFVRDNGVGFDMRYAEKLFGVFQRLHRPEEFEGTGIGLASVRLIVRRLGGRTWAEAEVDRGATFSFSLPRA